MPSKQNPGAFDCYAAAMPDEPIFTILARDPAGPATLDFWVKQRIQHGKNQTADDRARLSAALDEATEMQVWRDRALDASGDGEPVWRLGMKCFDENTNPIRILPSERSEVERISNGMANWIEDTQRVLADSSMSKKEQTLWKARMEGLIKNWAALDMILKSHQEEDEEIEFIGTAQEPDADSYLGLTLPGAPAPMPVMYVMTPQEGSVYKFGDNPAMSAEEIATRLAYSVKLDPQNKGNIVVGPHCHPASEVERLLTNLQRLIRVDPLRPDTMVRWYGGDLDGEGEPIVMMGPNRLSELLDYATNYGQFDENTPNGTESVPPSQASPMCDNRRARIIALKQVMGLLGENYQPPEQPQPDNIVIDGMHYRIDYIMECIEFRRQHSALASARARYQWTERLAQVNRRSDTEKFIFTLIDRIEKLGAHPVLSDVSTYLGDAVKALARWNDLGQPGMSGESILPMPEVREIGKSPALGMPYTADPLKVARKFMVDQLDTVIDGLDDDRLPKPYDLHRAVATGNPVSPWTYEALPVGLSFLIAVRDTLLAVDNDQYAAFAEDVQAYLDSGTKLKLDGIEIPRFPGDKIPLLEPGVDLAHSPEVPAHRFAAFHKGERYAYAKGLEVSPVHLPIALDEMAKSGWNLVTMFGATDSKHIGFIFEKYDDPRVYGFKLEGGSPRIDIDSPTGDSTIRKHLDSLRKATGQEAVKRQIDGAPLEMPVSDRGRGCEP